MNSVFVKQVKLKNNDLCLYVNRFLQLFLFVTENEGIRSNGKGKCWISNRKRKRGKEIVWSAREKERNRRGRRRRGGNRRMQRPN